MSKLYMYDAVLMGGEGKVYKLVKYQWGLRFIHGRVEIMGAVRPKEMYEKDYPESSNTPMAQCWVEVVDEQIREYIELIAVLIN